MENSNNLNKTELTPIQRQGWMILTNRTRKKYPYIKEIYISRPLDTYTTLMVVDIVIDLDRFYQTEGLTIPQRYIDDPYLSVLLKEPSTYMFTYVNKQYEDDYSIEFNHSLEEYMNGIYRVLPDDMKVITRWDNLKEISLGRYIPFIDVDKYIYPQGREESY